MLLLVRPGAEGEGALVPDADERHRVRSAVRSDGDDPVELSVGEQPLDVSHGGAVADASPYLGSMCPVVIPGPTPP